MYLFSAISADLKQKATVSPVLHQRYFQGYKVFNFISPEPKVEIRRRRVHIFVFFSRTTRPISTNLGTCKAPLGEGSSSFFFSNEGPFPKGENNKIVKKDSFHDLFLQNHSANFYQTWHKSSLGEREFKFVQMMGYASFQWN